MMRKELDDTGQPKIAPMVALHGVNVAHKAPVRAVQVLDTESQPYRLRDYGSVHDPVQPNAHYAAYGLNWSECMHMQRQAASPVLTEWPDLGLERPGRAGLPSKPQRCRSHVVRL